MSKKIEIIIIVNTISFVLSSKPGCLDWRDILNVMYASNPNKILLLVYLNLFSEIRLSSEDIPSENPIGSLAINC